ncbi:MAG: hypothetical protein C0402_05570, partial [Thermodesulfovibrio sp.]|nr:hypothetical protein [Thermodesulfovibrio sp.]
MLIPMPKVKRGVRLKIPYAAIIIDSQFLRDYVMRAAQFYLALGGMKTRSWSADTPIHEIAVDMDHALNDLLFENIVDEDTRAFLQSSCVDVQIETPQKEEATEKIEHEFVMKVSVSYFSIMSINFLDGLQKRNKRVYALVRKVLETLWAVPYAWINTQDSIHEQNEDFYGGWDEDDPEYSEMVEAMRVETELFKSHFA